MCSHRQDLTKVTSYNQPFSRPLHLQLNISHCYWVESTEPFTTLSSTPSLKALMSLVICETHNRQGELCLIHGISSLYQITLTWRYRVLSEEGEGVRVWWRPLSLWYVEVLCHNNHPECSLVPMLPIPEVIRYAYYRGWNYAMSG